MEFRIDSTVAKQSRSRNRTLKMVSDKINLINQHNPRPILGHFIKLWTIYFVSVKKSQMQTRKLVLN